MTFRVSLSRLFNEQMNNVKDMDTPINYKKVAQNIKTTEQHLMKLERSGITIQDMTLKNKVPSTNYTVVYKIQVSPAKKIIVKKILKHR